MLAITMTLGGSGILAVGLVCGIFFFFGRRGR